MKIKTILLVFLCSLFFSLTAHAEVVIKAEVDKVLISTDDVLTYKLIITSTENATPAPQFPKFEDFIVISNAQSQTVSFAKGGIRSIVVYAFILRAKSAGKFKVGPASIKLQDKVLTSDSFEIEVKQGKVQPKAAPRKESPQIPGQTLPESNAPQYNL